MVVAARYETASRSDERPDTVRVLQWHEKCRWLSTGGAACCEEKRYFSPLSPFWHSVSRGRQPQRLTRLVPKLTLGTARSLTLRAPPAGPRLRVLWLPAVVR